MTTTIAVHPISRKIILSQHPSLKINARDLLYHQLIYRNNKTKADKKLLYILTSEITLEVSKLTKKQKPTIQTGMFLYRTHMMEWMKFIYAHYILGKKGECDVVAMKSLEIFADLHDITVDDIEFDSVYRQWQRFRYSIKNDEKRLLNERKTVRPNIMKLQAQTPTGSEKLASEIMAETIEDFFSERSGNFKLSKAESLRMYLMYNLGEHTQKEIARIYRCSQSNVAQRLTAFSGQLLRSRNLRNTIKAVMR